MKKNEGLVAVSVVVPIYNSERYLEDCLNSIKEQTMQNIEIICIDDGSEDSSKNILKNYAEHDPRFIVIKNEKNKGLSISRNIGIAASQGKYLMFLDSDDKLKEFAIEELYYKAEEEGTDIIFFDSEMMIESIEFKGDEKQFQAKMDYDGIMSGKEYFLKMQQANNVRVPVWIQFWNKRSLDKMEISFLEGALHEDFLFTYMALMKAKRVICINKIYHIYRRHDDTISLGKLSGNHIKSLLEIYRLIEEFWFKNEDEETGKITKKYLDNLKYVVNEKVLNGEISFEDLEEEWGADSLYNYMLEAILSPPNICPINKKKIIKLLKRPLIYIYGAGKVAEKCLKVLNSYGIEVAGIVVSDVKNNPERLLNLQVCDIKDLLPDREKCTVLVGVGRQFRAEIVERIEGLGFSNYELLD